MKRSMLRVFLVLWLALISTSICAKVVYVYTDPQGTPLAEADEAGVITATFDYSPYGRRVLGNPTAGPGYTGHVEDPDVANTGLIYMQARYYDPEAARFLSVDENGPSPGNIFHFNRFAYANNNPILFIDLDGKQESPQWALMLVPGQGSWDNAVRSWDRGNYGQAVAYTGAMFAEQALYVASLGTSTLPRASATSARVLMTEAAVSSEKPVIGATGKIGEDALAKLGGTSQKYFRTSLGRRYVDQFVNGAAHESKVGYTTLSKSILVQIAKDSELLQSGQVRSVTWHFFESPATGKSGASAPLAEYLQAAGIGIRQ